MFLLLLLRCCYCSCCYVAIVPVVAVAIVPVVAVAIVPVVVVVAAVAQCCDCVVLIRYCVNKLTG